MVQQAPRSSHYGLILLGAVVALCSVGCSSSDSCPPGSESCVCSEGLCLGGLQCLSDRCVDPGGTGGVGGMAGTDGSGGMGGEGGSAGTGGVGGTGTENCLNEADQAVYQGLAYTDEEGNTFTGTEASAEIGIDCTFGTETSDPMLEGCSEESLAVLQCFPNCAPATVHALQNCVTTCTQDATGLSNECAACTGASVACDVAFCINACVADVNAPFCIACRCDNNCIQAFDDCSGLPPDGDCGTGGTGGMAGTGGSGGEGACTNEADQAIYEDLTYTDEDGVMYTGTEAASAIGSDCIFGTETSDPVLDGCGGEAFEVISCFPNCAPSVIQALADCVAMCTQDATGLSSECMACTGDTVACGAAFCTAQCVADTNAPVCIECRCDNGCIQAFDDCSGLPSDGDCGSP